MPISVLSAAEAAVLDRATIDGGVPSRALMQRAGAAAAGEIARRYGAALRRGVAVHAGPGNNGGDAWVLAAALARTGVRVRVALHGASAPRTDDARAERDTFLAARDRELVDLGRLAAVETVAVDDQPDGSEGVVVDGVLGIGARSGALPGWAAAAVRQMRRARERGAVVVALDVPTGLDATTGAATDDTLVADLTVTFAALKRGLLIARHYTGAVVVLDIGMRDAPLETPRLVTPRDVRRVVPSIRADAHKGTRGKLAIVGGGAGMAGAAVLAARAASASGAGMTRLVVAAESILAAQMAAPESLASPWPDDEESLHRAVASWADVVVIGPGLGRGDATRALCERVLTTWRGPTVIDADAITLFEGEVDRLAELLGGRPALLTPHPLECARLAGVALDAVLASRFEIGQELARRLGATVLLKGTPTVVSDGATRLVSAVGTPALGTAGSGDVLSGIAAALLADVPDAAAVVERAAAAAWFHGRAGEIATARRGGVRGTTLHDVVGALAEAWHGEVPAAPYPALAELPAVAG